jgi:hypothetical protein
MGWENTNSTGHYTMARFLSRSFLELALTRTDPHPTGAIQTAEGIKIHATVGHQTPTCKDSGVVYINVYRRIWNQSNLGRAAMDS